MFEVTTSAPESATPNQCAPRQRPEKIGAVYGCAGWHLIVEDDDPSDPQNAPYGKLKLHLDARGAKYRLVKRRPI